MENRIKEQVPFAYRLSTEEIGAMSFAYTSGRWLTRWSKRCGGWR